MLALQAEEGKGSGNPSKPQPLPSTTQPTHEEPIPHIESSSPQKTQSPRQALNKDTELLQTSVPMPNVPDEAVHQERGDSVERAATTATSLEAAPRDHGSASVQTRFERASKLSYDSPLGGGNTPRSDEDSLILQEFTALCTKLSDRVLALETDLRQTKKERIIEEIDQDVGVTLVTPTKVSSQEDQPEDQLGVLSTAKVLADAARVHTYSRRRRRAVSTDSGEVSTASRIVSTAGMLQQFNIIIPSPSATKDKGKVIMTESKPEQTTTKLKQRQERAGYEAAIRLQEQLDEEESQRITMDTEVAQRLQEEIDAAEKQRMAQKLQADERDKYSELIRKGLLIDLINQRKRYFVAQKAEAKRNKPMTQAQQRTYMSNYIKHMGSHTMQQLKRYTFDELKELFETTMKRVNTFTPMESDDTVPKVIAESSKRDAKQELNQEIPEEGMHVEALQTKYPIINLEVYTEDSRMYWKITRVGNHTEVYQIFKDMLKNFDKDDLVKLWNLVHE
ncbi:hypothetical protein Tco_1413329 [Tanacetum coccineum]